MTPADAPKLLLTSIPHTGTSFYSDVLKPFVVMHITAATFGDVLADADLLACTVRHPQATWDSWWHRGRVEDDRMVFRWAHGWRMLGALPRLTIPVYYLPIDHPSRTERLADLSAAMGQSYQVDWEKKINARQMPDRSEPVPPMPEADIIYSIPIIKMLY